MQSPCKFLGRQEESREEIVMGHISAEATLHLPVSCARAGSRNSKENAALGGEGLQKDGEAAPL